MKGSVPSVLARDGPEGVGGHVEQALMEVKLGLSGLLSFEEGWRKAEEEEEEEEEKGKEEGRRKGGVRSLIICVCLEVPS